MRRSSFALFLGLLASIGGQGQERAGSLKNDVFTTNMPLLPKGGVGVIWHPLCVILNSRRNELSVQNQRWVGKDAGSREVVLFFDHKVWASSDLPPGFELSRSILISFEGEFVRFFEFDKMHGRYYRRNPK